MSNRGLCLAVLLSVACAQTGAALAAYPGRPRSWAAGQQAGLGCPTGVKALTLPSTAETEQLSQQGPDGSLVYKPYVFARAAPVSWAFDLFNNGTWMVGTDGSRSWQLCIQAPEAHSLTILFRTLQLPVQSDLYLYSPAAQAVGVCGVGCQRFTALSMRQGSPVLAAPTPGDTLVLEYYQAPATTASPAVEIEKVLYGIKPLPAVGLKSALTVALAAANIKLESTAAGNSNGGDGGLVDSVDIGTPEPAPSADPSPGNDTSAASNEIIGDAGLANVDPDKIEKILEDVISQGVGQSGTCQVNVECDSQWTEAANAVTMLVGISENAGFYCTATLINAPNQEQLLISANHCLAQFSKEEAQVLWGVLFNYEARCGGSSPMESSYELLQGAQVLWTNEVTDVLLLRLNDEIPEGFTPYFLGWDATGDNRLTHDHVCISHPKGDLKKIAYANDTLTRGSWYQGTPEPTHYVVSFDKGQVQGGSSGSMLIDSTTHLGLGPLTGGTDKDCKPGGQDLYGSLAVAWDVGLKEFLQGPNGEAKMESRNATNDGPGMVVDPDVLLIAEESGYGILLVRLSESPASGATLSVTASVKGSGSNQAPRISPATLSFDESNWDTSQEIRVQPDDNSVRDGLQPFTVLLELRSDNDKNFYKRRTIVAAVLDDETPEGTSPMMPYIVATDDPSKPYQQLAKLTKTTSVPDVKLGSTTLDQFQGQVQAGAAIYFVFNTAQVADLSMAACRSTNVQTRIYAFDVDGTCQAATSEDCALSRSDPCRAYEKEGGCSGFDNLWVPGTNGAGAYTFAVISTNKEAGTFTLVFQQNQDSEQG